MRDDAARPPWSGLVDAPPDWAWQRDRLVAPGAAPTSPQGGAARRFVVRNLYATQNSAGSVRAALGRCLAALGPAEYGLDLGGGARRLDPRMINLDLADLAEVDIVGPADRLPFRDGTLGLVVAQEVFEHLPDPHATMQEIARVLRPGGIAYIQTPWMLGWHSGPHDFWRFSREGMERLFGEAFAVEQVGPSLGHGSGFYRVAVEYCAITASALFRPLYLPAKATAALLLIPFRWADLLSARSPQAHRIAGGFFAIARRR
jgi:SAM-dependent methyltransferase